MPPDAVECDEDARRWQFVTGDGAEPGNVVGALAELLLDLMESDGVAIRNRGYIDGPHRDGGEANPS
jgi:hypothetical protein